MVKHFPTLLQNRYRTVRILGEGGNGIVVLADDERLNRRVALKRLNPAIVDARSKVRIQREALIMARLAHPNILKIFDAFEDDSILYLVMEYANNESLADLLRRKSNYNGLPVNDVIQIGLSLCSALQTAHNIGIIHRDIKPENVLLDDTSGINIIKLADFGIAHLSASETMLTRTGEVIGTPIYLTPEQVTGDKITVATDIYALGILFYRLLTNRHYLPVSHKQKEIHQRILNEAPLPFDNANTVPIWFSKLIFKMLEKSPAQRPSLKTVLRQLEKHTMDNTRGKSPFEHIHPFIKSGRFEMRNVLKSVVLLLIAFWLFESVGGKSLAIPVIPFQIPTGNDIIHVATDFVSKFTPVSENSTAIVKNANQYNGLKLRAEPSSTAKILASLSDGTEVKILAYRASEHWALVQTMGKQGWVYTDYLYGLPSR